jgi:hypothetical protein
MHPNTSCHLQNEEREGGGLKVVQLDAMALSPRYSAETTKFSYDPTSPTLGVPRPTPNKGSLAKRSEASTSYPPMRGLGSAITVREEDADEEHEGEGGARGEALPELHIGIYDEDEDEGEGSAQPDSRMRHHSMPGISPLMRRTQSDSATQPVHRGRCTRD